MQKDLNKKLRLDSIEWSEVVLGLEGKKTFSNRDIKRALRKTGRSFNNNGPFYAVVRDFIKALGKTVTSKLEEGEMTYTITSTEDALSAVGLKQKTKPTESRRPCFLQKKVETINKETPEITITPDEDKIKDLFKRSYTTLDYSICLLAVYVKHSEKTLSGNIIKTELKDLGILFQTFLAYKPMVLEIYKRLGFDTISITKNCNGSTWKLEGTGDILDEYTRLCDIYKKLTGREFRNLDDYITTKTSKAEVEKRYELMMEEQKKTPREPRSEKDQEIMWKKWLLISSSKNALGASRSVSSLLSWIESDRHYKIDEEDAKKLYRELMEDTELGLRLSADYVTMSTETFDRIKKFYSPTKIKETILVKLPLSPEAASNSFQGLAFKLDETTTSGMYLYTIEINRGVQCEIALKKLLRFIQVSGKLYTENSWMVKRVMEIIASEDSKEKAKNVLLLRLEEKI